MSTAVISNTLEDVLLDMVLGGAHSAYAGLYLAYGTAGDDTGITEPVGNNYSRINLGFSAFNAASGGVSTLAAAANGAVATGSQGMITHIGYYTAASGGTFLAWGELTTARNITNGAKLRIAAGATVTLDGAWQTSQANNILDHLLRGASWTTGTSYLALMDTGGAELVGNGYARVATAGLWNAISGGATTNNAAIAFAAASGDWDEAVYGALFGASSGGNPYMRGTLTTPVTVLSGQTAEFAASAISLSVT